MNTNRSFWCQGFVQRYVVSKNDKTKSADLDMDKTMSCLTHLPTLASDIKGPHWACDIFLKCKKGLFFEPDLNFMVPIKFPEAPFE